MISFTTVGQKQHLQIATAGNPSLAMFKYSSTQVPIFEGEHYDYWSTEMMNFFNYEDLWYIIESDYPEPPTEDGADWSAVQQKKIQRKSEKNATALGCLKHGYHRIFNKRKAKEAWEVLQQEFHGNDKVVTIKLFIDEGKRKYQEFLIKLAEIVNNIQSLGDNIQDKRVVEKILRSLPPKLDHCVAAIKGSFQVVDVRVDKFSSST